MSFGWKYLQVFFICKKLKSGGPCIFRFQNVWKEYKDGKFFIHYYMHKLISLNGEAWISIFSWLKYFLVLFVYFLHGYISKSKNNKVENNRAGNISARTIEPCSQHSRTIETLARGSKHNRTMFATFLTIELGTWRRQHQREKNVQILCNMG